jgi:predicted DNA-binding transcriptional regulator YafY
LKHAVLAVNRLYKPPAPVIDTAALRRATWDERTVHLLYTDRKGAQSDRIVDPLGIVFLQDKLCLLGWCHLRKDNRVFRIDRIDALTVTDASFRPRRIPMLRDALAQIRDEVDAAKTTASPRTPPKPAGKPRV